MAWTRFGAPGSGVGFRFRSRVPVPESGSGSGVGFRFRFRSRVPVPESGSGVGFRFRSRVPVAVPGPGCGVGSRSLNRTALLLGASSGLHRTFGGTPGQVGAIGAIRLQRPVAVRQTPRAFARLMVATKQARYAVAIERNARMGTSRLSVGLLAAVIPTVGLVGACESGRREAPQPLGRVDQALLADGGPTASPAPRTDGFLLVSGPDGGVREIPQSPVRVFAGSGGAVANKPLASPGVMPFPTERERLVASLAAVSSTQQVWVIFTLDEVSVDWASFSELADADKQIFIASRKSTLQAKQAPFIAWVKAKGGNIAAPFFLVNHVRAQLPAGAVLEALAQPGVNSVVPDDAQASPATPETGAEVQSHIRTSSLYAAGVTGHVGGRSNGRRMRLGFIEVPAGVGPNVPFTGHPSLKKGHGRTGSRLQSNLSCPGSPCAPTTALPTGAYTHGQLVMGAAAGSIEDGQDPNFPGSFTSAQIQRSGNLRDAYLYY